MHRLIAAPVIGLVCALAGPIAAPAEEPAGKLVKPCVVITGVDSHVAERRYSRITSTDDWARVWQEHKGRKPTDHYDLFHDPHPLPLIDFDAYMLIAIFQGNGWNSAGLSAVSMSEDDKRIVFRFVDKGYQTGGSVESGGGAHQVAVCGFFVVRRSTKPLVLEEEMRTFDIRRPPVWKERITFAKL